MSPDVEQPQSAVGADPPVLAHRSGAAAVAAATAGRPSVRAATAETVEAAEQSIEQDGLDLPGTGVHGTGRHGTGEQEGRPDHHILRETRPDRWQWRAKIRRSPTKLRFYRVLVAVVGLFFIALGVVSGPIPGPGGIPLVLLGLGVWSSEFVWAQRLMGWFKAQLHRFQSWSRPRQALAWVAFFAVCGLLGYSYLLVIGAPGWLPAPVLSLLAWLPGV